MSGSKIQSAEGKELEAGKEPEPSSTEQKSLSNDTALLRMFAASYSEGPLPSADQLEQYNKVVPGLAERIIRAWETETEHRRDVALAGVFYLGRRNSAPPPPPTEDQE